MDKALVIIRPFTKVKRLLVYWTLPWSLKTAEAQVHLPLLAGVEFCLPRHPGRLGTEACHHPVTTDAWACSRASLNPQESTFPVVIQERKGHFANSIIFYATSTALERPRHVGTNPLFLGCLAP